MKKVLSCILAIAIAIVLFSAPSTAQATTSSSLTLVRNDDGVKIYQWLPDPFYILQNQYDGLIDFTTSDLNWHVPANKNFSFWYNFSQICNYTYLVYVNGQSYIYQSAVNSKATTSTIPASSTDSVVSILVIADSTNVYLDSYYGMLN